MTVYVWSLGWSMGMDLGSGLTVLKTTFHFSFESSSVGGMANLMFRARPPVEAGEVSVVR